MNLKFETVFLFVVPLSRGVTDAILAFSGNIPLLKLLFIAFDKGAEITSDASFTSFGGILSMPVALFGSIAFRSISMSDVGGGGGGRYLQFL